jgi:hypothetical protein
VVKKKVLARKVAERTVVAKELAAVRAKVKRDLEVSNHRRLKSKETGLLNRSLFEKRNF